MGLCLEEALGSGWQTVTHPDDVAIWQDYWRSLLESCQPGEIEVRLRRFDGTFRWFLIRAVPLLDESGNLVKWYGQNTDIEDRKRAETLLDGEKRFLEMVARGFSLTLVLEALRKLVEEIASGCYCTVILVNPEQTYLQQVISPSLPASFNGSIHGRPVNVGAGPCAMAACLNEQVITADILLETRWEASGWRSLALSHGLRACWSTPVASKNGKVLGTFALQYCEPGTPLPFHQSVIEQFTHLASIAIERAQGEDALKRSQAFLAQAQHVSSTGSFYWRVATDEIMWSEEVYRIFELDPAVPVTTELILSRVHPEDAPLLYEMIDRAQSDSSDFDYECRLLMPNNSVKYLQFAHGTINQSGQLEYIGAVQDVTKRRLSEEALSTARAELAHVARVTTLGALTASIAHEVNQLKMDAYSLADLVKMAVRLRLVPAKNPWQKH